MSFSGVATCVKNHEDEQAEDGDLYTTASAMRNLAGGFASQVEVNAEGNTDKDEHVESMSMWQTTDPSAMVCCTISIVKGFSLALSRKVTGHAWTEKWRCDKIPLRESYDKDFGKKRREEIDWTKTSQSACCGRRCSM